MGLARCMLYENVHTSTHARIYIFKVSSASPLMYTLGINQFYLLWYTYLHMMCIVRRMMYNFFATNKTQLDGQNKNRSTYI